MFKMEKARQEIEERSGSRSQVWHP